MINIAMKSILLVPVAIVAMAAGDPRHAPRHQVTVSYADLDLDSAAGNATLTRRIKAGVRQVCNARASDLASMSEAHRCRTEALAGAVAQRQQVIAQAEAGKRRTLASR